MIPPLGNTTFDVVFLGRDLGHVENTLYVHTSAASFRFVVKAEGAPNPYRLKPLVGVKMPLNSSYTPNIQLHNPHPHPIQIVEVYSSGGDLHLELPSGESEGPQGLWHVPAFATKTVMKANFVARTENNHTAYVRIKTNETNWIYLPVEVEVTSQPGIFCPQEMLDFGLMGFDSSPRSLDILLLNSGSKAMFVQNVVTLFNDNENNNAIKVDFTPLKVAADTIHPTKVARVTFYRKLRLLNTNNMGAHCDVNMVFSASRISTLGVQTGKILLKSRNGQFKVQVPFRAQIFQGNLRVNESSTKFHLSDVEFYDGRNFSSRNQRESQIFKST